MIDLNSFLQIAEKGFPVLECFEFHIIWEYRALFWSGLCMTLGVTFVAVTGGTIIGLFTGMARLGEVKRGPWKHVVFYFARLPAAFYVTFFRGTPLFIQIFLIHYALMPLLIMEDGGWLISGEWARYLRQNYGALMSGIVALTLNSGAYVTEIFRAGIQSIHLGQFEAARSLGMNYWQTMRFVIIPQAFRRMLPPLGNEVIMLLKDSSLVSSIGLIELAYAARTVAGAYSRYWEPYITVSLIYLALTMVMAFFVGCLEKKFIASGGLQ